MNLVGRVLAASLCAGSFAVSAADPKIDRAAFFAATQKMAADRVSFTAMDEGQEHNFRLKDGFPSTEARRNINLILDAIESGGYSTDRRQVAYVIATAYRESDQTMKPVHEVAQCGDDACIKRALERHLAKKAEQRKQKEAEAAKLGQVLPPLKRREPHYSVPASNGQIYYGRGFSQLTWDDSYQRFGRLLKMKPASALYDDPSLAMRPDIAAKILVLGMYDAQFTQSKTKLSWYFSESRSEWDLARRLVNPRSERATVTAGYGKLFYRCLGGDPDAPAEQTTSKGL